MKTQTIAIFGHNYIYLGQFKPIGQGKRTFEISECIDSKRDPIHYLANLASSRNLKILSSLDEYLNNIFFGVYDDFNRGISFKPIEYQTVKHGEIGSLDFIDFKDFPIDEGIGSYGQFLGEISGLVPTETKVKLVLVPGVKTHVLYTLKSKFEYPYRIYQISNLETFSGFYFDGLAQRLAGYNVSLCGKASSYFWEKLSQYNLNLGHLVEPYKLADIHDFLIPKLEWMMNDGTVYIESGSENLIREMQSFTYSSEMTYESLDSYPHLRAVLYLACQWFED